MARWFAARFSDSALYEDTQTSISFFHTLRENFPIGGRNSNYSPAWINWIKRSSAGLTTTAVRSKVRLPIKQISKPGTIPRKSPNKTIHEECPALWKVIFYKNLIFSSTNFFIFKSFSNNVLPNNLNSLCCNLKTFVSLFIENSYSPIFGMVCFNLSTTYSISTSVPVSKTNLRELLDVFSTGCSRDIFIFIFLMFPVPFPVSFITTNHDLQLYRACAAGRSVLPKFQVKDSQADSPRIIVSSPCSGAGKRL